MLIVNQIACNLLAGSLAWTKTACAYDWRNLESARLILADPDSHGGRESFAVIRDRAVVTRLGSGQSYARRNDA